MKKRMARRQVPALLLALLILCTACGSKTAASTMELTKSEGTVSVADENGDPIPLQDNMKLYGGYHVSTEEESRAWISLDEAAQIKLDMNSQIDIQKSGTEILVNSGSLFFSVTEPPDGGEAMTIRSSTMEVDIRSACGWVEAVSPEALRVCILEGTAECTVPSILSDQPLTDSVTAGGTAELTVSFGASSITVGQFAESDIPFFVSEALAEDDTPGSTSAMPT